jgi:uncharacterized protein YciI
MFLLLSRYLKPLDEVEKWVAEHRAYLDRHYASGGLVVSGPQEPRVGGVIVTGELSRAEVDALLAEDPFVREGVAQYEAIEFHGTKRTAALDSLLAKH